MVNEKVQGTRASQRINWSFQKGFWFNLQMRKFTVVKKGGVESKSSLRVQ